MNTNLPKRLTAVHISAKAFDDGDHWQDGKAFLPFVSLDTQNQTIKDQMQASLETENVIAEILDNEQNAVFGRETDWQIVPPVEKGAKEPSDAAAKFSGETEKAALDYWDKYKLLGKLKESNRLAACQETALIRAFLPKGLLSQATRKTDLRAAMDLWRFEVLPADKAGIFLDEETQSYYGLLKKQLADGKTYTEVTYVEGGKTFLKVIKQSDYAGLADETLSSLKKYMPADKMEVEETSYDLGGELLYFEIKRKPLITEAVMSNQKDVNLCMTMKNRLTYQAAYRDFFFFNSKQPTDAEGKPAAIKVGGKSANFQNGIPIYKTGGDGKPTGEVIGYANPSMTVVDPANPESIIKSKEASAFAIYNQASQIHLTRNQIASESGVSKRESRFSFEKKCNDLAQTINPAGRWMLKVLVLLGADNLRQSAQYAVLRYDFNCRIDAGAPDAEEIRQASADLKEGNLSLETYISKYLRQDDADAEMTRLTDSETYQLAIKEKRAAAAKLESDLGIPPEIWVATLYPDDEAMQLKVLPLIVEPKKEDLGVGE